MSPRLQCLFLSCLFPLILCSDPLKNPALNPVTVHAVPQHEAIELVKDGELRFAKVIHDRKRKVLYRLTDEQVIQIGKVGSSTYEKLKSSPENKEELLTPNTEAADGKEFYYLQAATRVGKRLLVLECRPQFIAMIYKNNANRRILEPDFNRK